jgi:hypothetical protein
MRLTRSGGYKMDHGVSPMAGMMGQAKIDDLMEGRGSSGSVDGLGRFVSGPVWLPGAW